MSNRKNVSLDPATLELLETLTARLGKNASAIIRDALAAYSAQKFPPALVGFVRLDRPGDVEWNKEDSEDNECSECTRCT